MRFKKYINESNNQRHDDLSTRSKVISKEKAIQIIKKHCKQITEKYKKTNDCIYRGLQPTGDDFFFNDPTKSKPRKSANTSNYYTLLIDNLSTWVKYPKRSESIVCTTEHNKAGAYGEIFIVFPYDNTKIAVCPEEDIWFSFDMSLNSLNNIIRELSKVFGVDLSETDWNKFKKGMKEIDDNIVNIRKEEKEFDEFISDSLYYDNISGSLFKEWIIKYGSLMNALEKEITPINFSSIKPGGQIPRKKEVWIGNGPSILIGEQFLISKIYNEKVDGIEIWRNIINEI